MKTNKREKIRIKMWFIEVEIENPTFIGAVIIIAVAMVGGLALWIKHHA